MKKIVYALLVLGCGVFPAQAQKEYGLSFSSLISDNLTLENAIRLGLENNSDFLTARQEIAVAEQKVNEAKFLFLPQFSLQGTATLYDLDYPMVLPGTVANRFLPGQALADKSDQFFGVGVTATQYLYSGGRIRNTLKIARANLKQVQSRYETVKNTAVLDIKKSFFNLLFAQQYDQFMQELLDQVARWQAHSSGDVWAQLRAQSAWAELQARRRMAARQLVQARQTMRVSLNKETNADFSIVGSFTPVRTEWELSQLYLRAMEYRPELKSALYALELDSISMDLALSKRYPDILLNASYEQLGADTLSDTNKQVSLSVRLPLPYNVSSQITQKKAEQKKSALRRAQIEDKIRTEVTHSFNEMRFWQEEVSIRQEQFDGLTEIWQRGRQYGSHQGVAPLEAAQSYARAAYDYWDALRQNLVAKAELEWAVGQDL